MKKILAFLVLCLLLSCNIFKTIHLLKQGRIAPQHFKEEIPFEFRAGIIIIKVQIEGKIYDFIFDSGATNAVSLELSKELNLNKTQNLHFPIYVLYFYHPLQSIKATLDIFSFESFHLGKQSLKELT